MKTKFYLLAKLMVVSSIICVGCSKSMPDVAEDANERNAEIVGTSDYLADLNYIKTTLTKSGEISEEEVQMLISPALSASISYLAENGYDFSEDFSPEDPRIVWVATGLAEYDKLFKNKTKTTVGGCVLEAIGVADLVSAAGKKIVKALAKQCLKTAVPYVGAALVAIDFILCVAE